MGMLKGLKTANAGALNNSGKSIVYLHFPKQINENHCHFQENVATSTTGTAI